MCPKTCLPEDGALVSTCGGVFGPVHYQASPRDISCAQPRVGEGMRRGALQLEEKVGHCQASHNRVLNS